MLTRINMIFKGTFGGYSGSTVPTGWGDGAGVPSGSVLSYTTDSAVPGQMVTLTHTATTAVRQLVYGVYVGATTLTNATSIGATSLVIPIRADYAGVAVHRLRCHVRDRQDPVQLRWWPADRDVGAAR